MSMLRLPTVRCAFLALSALVGHLIAFTAAAETYPDQGRAYAGCMAELSREIARGAGDGLRRAPASACQLSGAETSTPSFDCNFDYRNTTASSVWGVAVCTISTHSFPRESKCSSRSEEFGWQGGGTAGSVNACHQGCMYTSSLDPSATSGHSFAPTGGTCTEADAPAPTPAGGGEEPGGGGGETGGGDGGGTNPGNGEGGGGTNPGGGDGGGGTDPGEGEGEGGGTDPGTGPGPGPGDGDGDGDDDGPGHVGPDGDALYESDGKTVEKLYDQFAQRVNKAPIIDATKSFFDISVSGSCPVFTFPASAYWDAMTFDFLCKSEIVAILSALGWLLLAFAAFHAVKIALT